MSRAFRLIRPELIPVATERAIIIFWDQNLQKDIRKTEKNGKKISTTSILFHNRQRQLQGTWIHRTYIDDEGHGTTISTGLKNGQQTSYPSSNTRSTKL